MCVFYFEKLGNGGILFLKKLRPMTEPFALGYGLLFEFFFKHYWYAKTVAIPEFSKVNDRAVGHQFG